MLKLSVKRPIDKLFRKSYNYFNGTLYREQYVQNGVSRDLRFIYTASGITGFILNEEKFIYLKNNFGDVTGIYDANGNLICRYVYDAWGNHKVLNPDETENTSPSFIGNINPFRYRSYYFDIETGFYYLQSRYYDPQVGRFISMDAIEYLDPQTINGLNLYAYCGNDPVNNIDPTGHWFWVVVGAAVGAVVSAAFETAEQIRKHGWDTTKWDVDKIGRAAMGGAVSGAISSIPGLNVIGTALVGGAASLLGGLVSGSVTDFSSAATAFGLGLAGGLVSCGAKWLVSGSKATKILSQSKKTVSLKAQALKSVKQPKLAKGAFRNEFKNVSKIEMQSLIFKYQEESVRDWSRNSFISSLVSGWY